MPRIAAEKLLDQARATIAPYVAEGTAESAAPACAIADLILWAETEGHDVYRIIAEAFDIAARERTYHRENS